MRTSAPGVWAAGDVIEVPHGLSMLPISWPDRLACLLAGPRRRRQRGRREPLVRPRMDPWGFMSGDYTIGGFSIGETLAEAMGIPYVLAQGVGVSRARYFPGAAGRT